MRRRASTQRERREAQYLDLLLALSRQPLPVVCTAPEDIDRILALRSAALVEAATDPPVLLRTGERLIPRAVVLGITPAGRTALARMRSMRKPPEPEPHEPPQPAARPDPR